MMYRAGSGSDAAGGRSASLKKWEGPGHTGIVIADLGDRVLTIEGNVGDRVWTCLLYTSDAADERSSVDLGGRRIIKKKKHANHIECRLTNSRNNEIHKSI